MKLPRPTSRTLFVGFIISFVWLALVVAAPLMVPADTLQDLSGRVGTRDNTNVFSGLSPLPRVIYTVGDVECHQIAERSYYLNGNQMPFCARDLGLFVGLAFGFAIVSFFRFRGNPFLLLLGLVPMGVDGGLQLVTSYESMNPVRLATGVLAGASLALLLALYVHALEDIRGSRGRPDKGIQGDPNMVQESKR
ncbi:MAG: DUF2085 domain-containing protein [Thermoplasmata archaeon]